MKIDQPEAGPGPGTTPSAPDDSTGDTPPGTPQATGKRRRRVAVAAVAAAVVLAGGGAYALFGPSTAYQKVGTTGADPFMAPIGQDVVDIAPVAAEGLQRTGDTGGLYAADPNAPYCDIDALIGQLQDDPAKSAAWAGVLGISPDGISPFAKSLSPVALRADTAVLDHGYADGTFVSTPTVLQAGTAVLINSYGEPTVKCMSGDPLTRPVAADSGGGSSGGGGSGGGSGGTPGAPAAAPALDAVAASATVILPAQQQIPRLQVVNPQTGKATPIPGKPDPKPKPGPNPTPTPTTPTKPGPVQKPPAVVKPTPVFAFDGLVITPPDAQGRAFMVDSTGKTIKTFSFQPGTKLNPDGSFTYPDGSVHDSTGRARVAVAFPDGRVLQPNGTVLPPLPTGESIRWTDNGQVIRVQPNGKIVLLPVDKNGQLGKATDLPTFPNAVRQPDGSWLFNDGKVRNPDGTIRKSVVLPGGDVLLNNGGYFPKEAPKPADKTLAGEVEEAQLAAPVDPKAPAPEAVVDPNAPADPNAAPVGEQPAEEGAAQPGEEGAGEPAGNGAGEDGAGQPGGEGGTQPGPDGQEGQPGGDGGAPQGGDGAQGEAGAGQ